MAVLDPSAPLCDCGVRGCDQAAQHARKLRPRRRRST